MINQWFTSKLITVYSFNFIQSDYQVGKNKNNKKNNLRNFILEKLKENKIYLTTYMV